MSGTWCSRSCDEGIEGSDVKEYECAIDDLDQANCRFGGVDGRSAASTHVQCYVERAVVHWSNVEDGSMEVEDGGGERGRQGL
jgi:hypothetical protein